MAGPLGPRRDLSADRALRLGRRHLQSFFHAGAGRGAQIPDQAARTALHRGDGVESRQGQRGRRSGRICRRQSPRLHAARRRAVRPAGRQLRRSRAYRDRHGDFRIEARPAHDFAAGGPLLQPRRLSPLRRHHRGLRRARAHQRGARQEPRVDPAQSRPAHRRQDRARGVRADEVAARGRPISSSKWKRPAASSWKSRRRSAKKPPINTSITTPVAARRTGRPICACSTRSMRAGGIEE